MRQGSGISNVEVAWFPYTFKKAFMFWPVLWEVAFGCAIELSVPFFSLVSLGWAPLGFLYMSVLKFPQSCQGTRYTLVSPVSYT